MSDHEAKRLVKLIRHSTEASSIRVIKSLGVEFQKIRKVKIERPSYEWDNPKGWIFLRN